MSDEPQMVDIHDLDFDTNYQMRADLPSVNEYKQLLLDSQPDEWPFQEPLVAYRLRGKLKVVSGFTRGRAAQLAERQHVPVLILTGSKRDALNHALGANAEHGYRRTNRDKRKAVLRAIGEYPDHSAVAIAELCKVSHTYVYGIRAELSASQDTREDTESRPAEPVAVEADQQKYIQLGECPICRTDQWLECDSGHECSVCQHQHGEPAGADSDEINEVQTPQGIIDSRAVQLTRDKAKQVSTEFGRVIRGLNELGILAEVASEVESIKAVLNEKKRNG